MRRIICLAAIACILVIGQFMPIPGLATKEVQAQISACSDYDFPSESAGWSIDQGEAVMETKNIIHNGTGTIVIDATLTLDHPVYVESIRWATYAVPQTQVRHEYVYLYDPNYPADPPTDHLRFANFDIYPALDTPVWRAKTGYFFAIPTNKIQFVMTQESGSLLTALHVVSICITGQTIVTVTPSPTISPTPSITPTPPPTWSPTPSFTPEFTDTPEPTSTSGGATSTATAPVTATGVDNNHTGNFIFNTVAAPDQCSTITNPCGAMPFPVPGFSNVSIASPTALASITAAASVTFFPTMTAYGTPFGTAGPGTPTPAAGPGDAFEGYATSISGQLVAIQMTPGLIDPNGSLIDIRNGAYEIGGGVGNFFSILKALQNFFLGKTGNIIAILLLLAGFVITVKLLLWMLPIIRAIATFIVGFIP